MCVILTEINTEIIKNITNKKKILTYNKGGGPKTQSRPRVPVVFQTLISLIL